MSTREVDGERTSQRSCSAFQGVYSLTLLTLQSLGMLSPMCFPFSFLSLVSFLWVLFCRLCGLF